MSTKVSTRNTPLDREAIRAFFEEGCRPRSEWRVGTEYEKFAVDPATRMPLPYHGAIGIESILHFLADRFGWDKYTENGHLIALTRDDASLTLEPGGQVELSGGIFATIHETHAELQQHLHELETVSKHFPVEFEWVGLHPLARLEDVQWVPKGRYGIMASYLPTRGTMALAMMKLTCTVQANIDYSDELDAFRKIRTGFAVSPIVSSIFANSPLVEGKPSGYRTFRQHIWSDVDPDRCGLLPFVFGDNPDIFTRYAEWALDVPMFFIHRDGRYVDAAGIPFRKYLNEGFMGHHATIADWELHLSTLFPDIRLKKYIETRSADTVPPALIPALPAFWKGLCYQPDACAAAWDVMRNFTVDEHFQLRQVAARHGLMGSIGGHAVQDLARELVSIAKTGLKQQSCLDRDGRDESCYLEMLEDIVTSGQDPASQFVPFAEDPNRIATLHR